MSSSISNDIVRVMYSEEEIKKGIQRLCREINAFYRKKNPVFICILKGGFVFLSDLLRNLPDLEVTVDFIAVSSYGRTTETSGIVRILKDLNEPITGRHVLIVEDIVDSGLTLSYIRRLFQARDPKSLKICTLLDKESRRMVPVPIDYTGFIVPDEFVVGYGLDYDEKYRNLPYIGVLKKKIYNKG